MFPPGGGVLAAVSGGADSAALLQALVLLSERLDTGSIGVVHVHHGLRGPEADRDAAFAERLAQSRGLPFFLSRVDAAALAREGGLCVEEAGRNARYAFFERVRKEEGFARVAVAHTADDNAETVLMFLLRGAGPRGLAGISPLSGNIARPLLSLSRRHVLDFCAQEGLDFFEDSTNLDLGYLRNRIRRELLPLIARDYNPAALDSLNRLASLMREEEDLLESLVSEALGRALAARSERAASLSLQALRREHPALRRRMVRAAVALVKGDLRRLSFSHVAAVLALSEGKTTHLPCGVTAQNSGGLLTIARPENFKARPGKK